MRQYLDEVARSATIPILGIPVLNRFDLLQECIRTIDVQVGVLLLIDNSDGDELEDAIEDVVGQNESILKYHVIKPIVNSGVAASWNLIIKSWPDAPWWCIANADTVFGRGDLAVLSTTIRRYADDIFGIPQWVGINGDWRAFGITPSCIERVGWFDENFHPIYCEDADYERRCTIEGVRYSFIDGTTTHVGSASWVGDKANTENNARTYPEQVRYYEAKWGSWPRAGERYLRPFDDAGHPTQPQVRLHRLIANRWDRDQRDG